MEEEPGATNQVKLQDFTAREYQVEILEKAIKENVLVFLPTGSGKTFIAVMLINHFLKDIKKDYSDGGKRVFFLVTTTPLVKQQADAIRNLLPVEVGEYIGADGVDLWNGPRWLLEQDKYNVLVMTSQIYLDMVLHGYTDLGKACLLIFDECHNAVGNHPMRQIMMELDKKDFSDSQKPKIFGLTATLLNTNVNPDKVAKEVETLEATFHAHVVKALNEEMVLQYSANPDIELMLYDEEVEVSVFTILIDEYLVKAEQIFQLIHLPELMIDDAFSPDNDAKLLNDITCKPLKRVILGLKDAKKISKELGLYAMDISLLSLIILIERFKLTSHDNVYRLLCSIETGIHLLRKRLSRYLDACAPSEKALLEATNKVKTLASILTNYPENQRTIVFVDRRSTAHSLHHIFMKLSQENSNYKNIKSDYIIGVNQSDNSISRESILSRKKNKEVMKKFNNGDLNMLFASNVIEEGIDIRLCNLVIKFDMPTTFRSYTQSKGRARHRDSKYIIIAATPSLSKESDINTRLRKFQAVDRTLKHVLCSDRKTDDDVADDDEDAKCQFVNEYGNKVTGLSSISLINRYCSKLPQDKFCKPTALWWLKEIKGFGGEKSYVCYLKLPINSSIKTTIEGPSRKNKLSSKRLVALEACKILYEHGEFDPHFLPFGQKTDLLGDITLFPKWKEDYLKAKLTKEGRKERRFYDKHYSKWECKSKPSAGSDVFMHIIKISPNYAYPDTNRLQSFYNLLLCDNTFCVLTTCSWPELPDFPLYMNVGEVKIEVLNNSSFLQLSAGEIKELERFQKILFTGALNLLKNYAIPNEDDCHVNDFIIAPVVLTNRCYEIDWNTVRSEEFPEITPKPFRKRLDHDVTEDLYNLKVVIPWYRHEDYNLKYVVTNVRTDQTPESKFPSESYKNYSDYFFNRYNQKIYDKDQPLLEVRAISGKINCLLPRALYHSSKRQKKEDDGFEETLVPELCYLITFPAWYLVKVTLLPSALHRIHHLLIAEELRQKIAEESGLGSLQLPYGKKWKTLEVNDLCKWKEEEEAINAADSDLVASAMQVDEEPIPIPTTVEEPIDLERLIDDVDLTAVAHFTTFVDRPIDTEKEFGVKDYSHYGPSVNHKPVEPLKIIKGKYPGYGPEPVDILEALTAASSNDVISYERTELMGDSFLKFAASLALFTFYPNLNEGKLTQVKGKIIGNRNLFFCGLDFNLPGLLKVNAFDFNDWKVPGYSLPAKLKPYLKDPASCSELLAILSENGDRGDVYASLPELLKSVCGSVSSKTPAIEFKSSEKKSDLSSDESDDEPVGCRKVTASSKDEYLMKHLVPDKVVSDSIEALISVYVQNFGIEGGFKILEWMGVLPRHMCNIQSLLHSEPESPLIVKDCDFTHLIPNAEELEKTLGYTFRNKAFLLQALSHSSQPHNITDCYQRYEFLGDAILDFLLTCYIYEEFKQMKPGDMTDLRSALVNNVTFACLAVRYKFHTHLIARACKLTDYIAKFVKNQQRRNHEVDHDVFYLIEETNVNVAECVEVPKVLGDLFESIIAAVYLDCNKDLNRVWTVVYNIMEPEIKKFSRDIPKNPIRMVYEKFTSHPPKFGKAEAKNDVVMIPLEVTFNESTKIFHGIGENKYFAKVAASKLALHHFKMHSQNI